MRRWVLAVTSLLCTACAGGQAAPPQPRSVAYPAAAPAPHRQPQPPAQVPPATPRPLVAGAVHWHERLADAQAQARSSGRLLLVGSTKPDCSMCDKFMHEIAPQCAGRLNQVAVAYVYDITRPESSRVDGALRANLPGAILMPLVGFFTADMTWVHGFSGPRTAQEFMGDVETAARMHPLRAAAMNAVSGPALAQVSFVNEFGETEWSAPADAWPKPVDALGAQPVLALAPPTATSAFPAANALAANPAPAPQVGASPPNAEPSIGSAPVVASAEPMADPAAGWSTPPSVEASANSAAAATASFPTPAGPPEPTPALEPGPVVAYAPPEPLPIPAPLPAPLPALVAPAPSAIAAVPMDEAAARASLGEAFNLIRQGQYDRARDELRRVSRSLPHTGMGREADRGGVAVYNARRIADAGSDQRADLAAQARRALSGTMWETLF